MNTRRSEIDAEIFLWIRQVIAMTAKEFPQLIRDRAIFIYFIYIFTLDIIIATEGITMELHNATVAVYDASQSAESRELIYRFQRPYFTLYESVEHPDFGLQLLDKGKATLFLDIPPRFAEILKEGEATASAQLLVDTSTANTGYLASSYATRITDQFSNEWKANRLSDFGSSAKSLPSITNQRRIRFNPDIQEAWFGTISELLAMITVACMFLPAIALVREKERGTLEQLLVSPLTPFQVMFSKILAMVVVMLIGTSVSLFIIMQPLFDVPVQGSLILFFTLTALYAFTTAGLGLVAATFARNSAQLGMLLMLILPPIIMLSGIWVALESMPTWLLYIMNASPLRYFVEIAYGILLRGAGIETLWDSILKMSLLGSVLFAIGLWRFRRQFAG